MAGFNLQEFKTNIELNGELLRTNKFLVEFTMPSAIKTVVGDTRSLSLYCKSASLPGVGIMTSDDHLYGYGPQTRNAYATIVNNMLMLFYVDGEAKIKSWMNAWTRLVIDHDSRNGLGEGTNSYVVGYKDDYVVDLKITAFNQEGKPRSRTTLIRAYPNYVGDISVDWSEKNNLMIMPVSFDYRDWYEEILTGN